MWFHSNHLLQLPHFDQQCIKMVNKGISASKHAGGAIDKAPYPPTVGWYLSRAVMRRSKLLQTFA